MSNSDDQDVASDDTDTAVPLDERKLITQSYDLSVSTLIEQWSDDTLVLPEIQREYVWSDAKASRLIESLLLNVPIPVIYLAESPEDRYEVIDGHQRIASIARYVANRFKLTGLRVISDREHLGKRFNQLPAPDQRRIKTRVMRAIIITEESHPSMKFEVFERLNAGSTSLNAQEIRNSTYRGSFMNRVKQQWVLNEDFRQCVNTKEPRSRMVDHELIIRFLALRDNLDGYRPPLPRFLNNYCKKANNFTDNELEEVGDIFDRSAKNVNLLYGDRAFRLTDTSGGLIDRSLNRGLVEVQLYTMSFADEDEVIRKADKLRRELGMLHTDPTFLDYIQRAIVDKSRTVGRIQSYASAFERAGVKLHL